MKFAEENGMLVKANKGAIWHVGVRPGRNGEIVISHRKAKMRRYRATPERVERLVKVANSYGWVIRLDDDGEGWSILPNSVYPSDLKKFVECRCIEAYRRQAKA